MFLSRLLNGERLVDLCREFGISEKTGRKFKKRYERHGVDGLKDLSRRPHRSPRQVRRDMVTEILAIRHRYPNWGPKKLKDRLHELIPGLHWPAASTIGVILKNEGLVKERKRRYRGQAKPTDLRTTLGPNELWCIDFKGHFRLGNKRYCYPLTVTDHFSRFILGCEALESTKGWPAQVELEDIFQEFGLPTAIRSDNGSPFASSGRLGLTPLAVWLMRLGIELERIEPGHPEQNGRHERMHLTLKTECTRPPAGTLLEQQEKFDSFVTQFNNERPHEALEMKRPANVFKPSNRPFPEELQPLDYPLHDLTKVVRHEGHIHVRNDTVVYVSTSLAGERLGLRQLSAETWLVTFMDLDLGYIDTSTKKFIEMPLGDDVGVEKTEPMSPV
jgi:transposase InsO family protein